MGLLFGGWEEGKGRKGIIIIIVEGIKCHLSLRLKQDHLAKRELLIASKCLILELG